MWRLGPAWDDEAALAERWRSAAPFPHLVFDAFAPDPPALLAALEDEPVTDHAADIYAFEASPPVPASEGLRALRDDFAALLGPPLTRITGRTVRRAEMRAYAYRAGHYLLPHSDHQLGVGRLLAFAYYLPSPERPVGGELELFRCVHDGGGEIVATESVASIAPEDNRLVVFEVGDDSLHQVREVLAGQRLSLSGWFFA